MTQIILKVDEKLISEKSISPAELAFSMSMATGFPIEIQPVSFSAENLDHEVAFYGVNDIVDQKIMSAWDEHMGH